MDAFSGESVALSLIQSGTYSKQRETSLETGLEQLERSTKEMVEWLKKLLDYVSKASCFLQLFTSNITRCR